MPDSRSLTVSSYVITVHSSISIARVSIVNKTFATND